MKRNDTIERIRKSTPLYIRLRVMFHAEYLCSNIVPDRETTDEENAKAHEWAVKMTNWAMEHVEQWEKDGRPTSI